MSNLKEREKMTTPSSESNASTAPVTAGPLSHPTTSMTAGEMTVPTEPTAQANPLLLKPLPLPNAIAPMEGYEWNPLRTLPPNQPCPCLSGRKFKKCCKDGLPLAVPKGVADQFRAQMKKPDLVFLTKTNGEKVMQATKQQLPRCETCGALVAGPHDCPGSPEVSEELKAGVLAAYKANTENAADIGPGDVIDADEETVFDAEMMEPPARKE